MLYTYLLQGHLNILNCPHLGGKKIQLHSLAVPLSSCSHHLLLLQFTLKYHAVWFPLPPHHSPKNSWQGYCDVHVLNPEEDLSSQQHLFLLTTPSGFYLPVTLSSLDFYDTALLVFFLPHFFPSLLCELLL